MTTRDDDNRPNPDQLLGAVRRARQTPGRGQLKVFLGMAAGVGKTFAMLQRAHQLKHDGIDVVVGWVETHGRKETAALVEGLEIFPRKAVVHREVALEEMDIDGLLLRHPKVVLVDELAHTNAPQSRHEKRYQDVEELLASGIDVYTTVNVQHLESRVDTVRSIVGIAVRETVPDAFLDSADEIVLIDLPPEDLIRRLQEGRVYPAERAEAAGRNFFKPGNLTALRELALRTATGRVDRDLREFKTLNGIQGAWKSSSRLLVAVYASPYSESLIRGTRQLADTMGGSWLGAYIDTGAALTDEEKSLLDRNTLLIRQLGGEFVTVKDNDLVGGLLLVARQQHVTQIVVGKSQRGGLKNFLSGGSIVHRLLRRSGDIDVYAVSPEAPEGPRLDVLQRDRAHTTFPWGESGWVVSTVFSSWLAASALQPLIGYQSVGILFLMTVLGAGVWLSRASVFAIAVLLSAVHNYFFIPPVHTFAIREPHDALMAILFLVAASAIGHLTTRLKKQNFIIEKREDRALTLFQLSQALSEASGTEDVVRSAAAVLNRVFDAEVSVIQYTADGAADTMVGSSYLPDEKELAVAEWVRRHAAMAGRFTETLPSSASIFLPLQSRRVVLGVLGMRFPKEAHLDFDRRMFAQALAGQVAASLEREMLHDSRQKLEVLEQADKLYRSLFDSVSHELKTPLTTIRGAVSALGDAPKDESAVKALRGQVVSETQRLISVVDNMLDMTRLESGSVRPKFTVCDVADVLGPAIRRVEAVRGAVTITTKVDERCRSLRCDVPLTVQALANVVHNAVVHAGPRGVIEIAVTPSEAGFLEITVTDSGPGLPKPHADVVFEKFFRSHPERSGGLGLGLSIARGFVEAQGGSLLAGNGKAGGAVFTFRLPVGTEG